MWKRWLYLLLALGLTALIVFTSTRTGEQNDEAGGNIIEWINASVFQNQLDQEEQTSIVGVAAKLFGHFSLFLVDGLFFDLFLRTFSRLHRKRIIILLVVSLLLSSLGEIIQIFSVGRYPALRDVFLDMTGFWMAPLLTILYDKELPEPKAKP